MNIFALIHRYEQESNQQPFSPSEAAMYLKLLCKANSLHWQMPIRCPTSKLCIELKISKPSLADARRKLKERGMIDYIEGYGKTKAPAYTLIDLTDNLTDSLTDNLTDSLTDSLTDNLTDSLTIYKIKTKDKNKDKNENFINSNHLHDNVERGGRRFSLKDLELRLSEDTEWLDSIHSLLSEKFPITPADVKSKLVEFFKYLRCYGYQEKSEKACRVYFLNWLNKNLIQQKDEQHTKQPDLRRSSAVTASSPKDYEGAF
jgi:DNA-binding Lrp family transcriptional regulator